MSLTTQTTQEITDLIVATCEASLSQSVPLLPKAAIRVLAKAQAGMYVQLWHYAGFNFLQLIVRFASYSECKVGTKRIRPLVEWGRFVGAGDPGSGERATLDVSVPVTQQTGTLKAGAFLLRAETGVLYQVLAPVTLNAASVTARVRAVSDQQGNSGVGALGNLVLGDTLSFAQTQPNVGSTATVSAVVTQGSDPEDPELYRSRVIKHFQRRKRGGAYSDYAEWAETVPGIINAYPYASEDVPTYGPGYVIVYCEATEASSGSPDGVPTGGQLTAVEAAINGDIGGLASRRPVNGKPLVLGIVRDAYTITITGLQAHTGTLDELKAAVVAGVDEFLRSREPYIDGLTVLPRKDRITEAAVAGVVDEIVDANGGSVSQVTMSPPATLLAPGHKAKLVIPPTYN